VSPRSSSHPLVSSVHQKPLLTSPPQPFPLLHPCFRHAEVSTEMLAKIRAATFAILDTEGHPVCCGFFVSSCGVALTAAHEADKWLINKKNKTVARAATFSKTKFELEVVEPSIGDLDIAVLRVPTPPTAPRPCLPVPENTFTEDELSGAAVNLIHGSIAWFSSMDKNLPKCSQRAGSIIHTTDTTIHYDVGTYKGDSGAALLLSGKRVIGLHSEGFNDVDQAHSETSPSTAADAVRLDLPEVRAAVMKYMKKKSS
jgi:hypothetical protein